MRRQGGRHGEETDGATIKAKVSGVDLRSISAEQPVEKQIILNEFVHVCGYHRQYTIGLLNRPLPRPRPRRRPHRAPVYAETVIEVLAQLWAASDYWCAVRLKVALPQ